MSDISEAIRDANATLMAVFGRGDAEGMAALYTPDGTLLPPGTGPVRGQSAIAGFWRGVMDMGVASAQLETVEVDAHGDTVIEIGRYRLGTTDGETADEGKYLVVWKRYDRAWKLHRDVWNTSRT